MGRIGRAKGFHSIDNKVQEEVREKNKGKLEMAH
jgi:hypothetical protein